MDSAGFHNVTEVKVCKKSIENKVNDTPNSRTYHCLDILIKQDNGRSLLINCFSDYTIDTEIQDNTINR